MTSVWCQLPQFWLQEVVPVDGNHSRKRKGHREEGHQGVMEL